MELPWALEVEEVILVDALPILVDKVGNESLAFKTLLHTSIIDVGVRVVVSTVEPGAALIIDEELTFTSALVLLTELAVRLWTSNSLDFSWAQCWV